MTDSAPAQRPLPTWDEVIALRDFIHGRAYAAAVPTIRLNGDRLTPPDPLWREWRRSTGHSTKSPLTYADGCMPSLRQVVLDPAPMPRGRPSSRSLRLGAMTLSYLPGHTTCCQSRCADRNAGRPGQRGLLIEELSVLEAVAELADHAVEKVALGGGVPVCVIVAASPVGGFGAGGGDDRGERP